MIEPVISARDLGKTVGPKTILCGISVDVNPGSVVGIIGKNGAGKTTLMEASARSSRRCLRSGTNRSSWCSMSPSQRSTHSPAGSS
ncbi:MAG: ATP-binding cassette domain-containing protein [Steroidobacteraceae bacterium]